MKFSHIAFTLLASSALALAPTARADETAASLAFIKGMGINANFGQMLRFGASRMQTFQNIVCVLGGNDGKQLVEQELSSVVAKYQPQWDRNLAVVWIQFLSEAEMQSLLELKQQSPYASKYQAAGPQAGRAMMASSSELLQRALSEGMNNAWSKASSDKSANPAAPCKS